MNLNIVIDLISFVTVLVVLFCHVKLQLKSNTKQHRVFTVLMATVLITLSFDIIGWAFDGRDIPGAKVVLYIFDSLYWLAQITYSWIWLNYCISFALKANKSFMSIGVCTIGALIAEIVILSINLKTGWVFSISDTNTYIRGEYYNYNLIPFYLYIISATLVNFYGIVKSKDYLHKKSAILLSFYFFLPVIGILIQSFTYGLSLIWPFCSLALLMVFLTSQQEKLTYEEISVALEKEKRAQLEKELLDNKIKIMISQIQPHFLYNSLTVITQLCDIDPKKAKEATIYFSKYLRANIDSLSETAPLPFETELQHIKTYLALEKLRFEDDLNIVYDIKTTSFLVPSLSIQPLVENSVKYGVCQKEDGGTIIISTYEDDTDYVVKIVDDGIGFDKEEKKKDGRTHIGIQNSRNRIKNLCNGTLDIESSKNKGTTVTIRIPKGE